MMFIQGQGNVGLCNMSMGVMYFGYVCDVFFLLQDLMYNFVMVGLTYVWNAFVVF